MSINFILLICFVSVSKLNQNYFAEDISLFPSFKFKKKYFSEKVIKNLTSGKISSPRMARSSLLPWGFSFYFVLVVLVVPIICQSK